MACYLISLGLTPAYDNVNCPWSHQVYMCLIKWIWWYIILQQKLSIFWIAYSYALHISQTYKVLDISLHFRPHIVLPRGCAHLLRHWMLKVLVVPIFFFWWLWDMQYPLPIWNTYKLAYTYTFKDHHELRLTCFWCCTVEWCFWIWLKTKGHDSLSSKIFFVCKK